MIAYIRIPKTASCTVLAALEGSGVQSVDHEPLSFYRRQPDFGASFTFVRNPWERMFSWYRHSKMFQRRTFEDYVLGTGPAAFTEVYRHGNADQTDLLVADQREWWRGSRPTFIGKFENLERDLRCIGELLDFHVGPIQHLNISNDTPAHPYSPDLWTPEMILRMAPIFDDFAEEFGYEL
tara:strand:+ start:9542 stop:10081 length:540 start_codon:yes stop_codon:yes gene_type:complete